MYLNITMFKHLHLYLHRRNYVSINLISNDILSSMGSVLHLELWSIGSEMAEYLQEDLNE